MSYRFMRILLFFDLPAISSLEKRNYRKFRNFLIKEGFIMMQESVYSKLVLNATAANAVTIHIRRNSPPSGIVQILIVTEKQYNSMEFIIGECKSNVINNDKRLVVL
ncbi:MAG: CRISPR-associated endonuclease Cas2 [Treponemataceae bacterium]